MTHEERKAQQREYNRLYYAKNREREQARAVEYRRTNPETHKAATVAWRTRNADRFLRMQRKWRAGNVAHRHQYKKAYNETNAEALLAGAQAYREANPEKVQAWRKRRLRERPEENRLARSIRRAREKQAMPVWADCKAMKAIYREAVRLTKETGIPHHVDHVVPLRARDVCGLHWEGNLQILVAKENQSKGNRWWPDDLAIAA